jgi:hypothetical protein
MIRPIHLLTTLLAPALLSLSCALAACQPADGPSMIRIHNTSSYEYQELEVGDQYYGTLGPDAYTEYREFTVAYRYNYVRLTIAGDEFVLQPIDYVGEQPLGLGDFTYEIDIADYDARGIDIQAVAE